MSITAASPAVRQKPQRRQEKLTRLPAAHGTAQTVPQRGGNEPPQKETAATWFDPSALCAKLVMTWNEIRRLAAGPLVTIGAHTRRHFAPGKLTLSQARDEMAQSLARIERELGMPCRRLGYSQGDERSAGEREFQLASALATRTG